MNAEKRRLSFSFLSGSETADALLARVCGSRMSMTDDTDAMSYAGSTCSSVLLCKGMSHINQERPSFWDVPLVIRAMHTSW